MTLWIPQALNRLQSNAVICRIAIVANQGSTPREEGASMLVGPDFLDFTIGGGRLEHEAIRKARQLIKDGWQNGTALLDDLTLGPALGQCCGGATRLLFERIDQRQIRALEAVATDAANGFSFWLSSLDGPDIHRLPLQDQHRQLVGDIKQPENFGYSKLVSLDGTDWLFEVIGDFRQPVLLFGAGHVGKAVASAIAPLPFNLFWLDSREDQVTETQGKTPEAILIADPVQAVDAAPEGCWSLVMTHSHALDEAICERFLERDDFGYLGLIGSDTKRASFAGRYKRRGIDADRIEKIHCPIGLPGITGKEPAVIAASVVADLLQRRHEGGISSRP